MSCPNSDNIYGVGSNPLLGNNIEVSYDNQDLCPTPIINYSNQPVEYGYVYGYNTEITLDGLITGISTPELARAYLNNIFEKQFKELKVNQFITLDNQQNELYNWKNIVVNNISLEKSRYFEGSFIKYQVRCTSYALPSGVIDPSNEFSFSEGDDGTITVTQKISARGIRNDPNGNQHSNAFENARSFVQNLTGQKPTFCGTKFLPSNDGVLLSLSENINRLEGVYSVTKTYKYNSTDPNQYFVRYTTLEVEDSIGAEYKTANYTLKFIGSTVEGQWSDLYREMKDFSEQAVEKINLEYNVGATPETWIQNSYSANIDDGSKTIDIKIGYLIGANLNGFFDYVVNLEEDKTLGIETWKIDGEFRCFGPLSFKRRQLESFKNTNRGADGWKSYLINLIKNSPLYIQFHDSINDKLHSDNVVVNVNEIKDMASLKLSTALNMGYEPLGTTELKYTINCSPSRRLYELLPSANIEGAYVIQDLQTKTNTALGFSISAKSSDKEAALSQINNFISGSASQSLSLVYAPDFRNTSDIKIFVNENTYSKSTYDINASLKYLGKTTLDDSILGLVSVGSFDSAPRRRPGYQFGY